MSKTGFVLIYALLAGLSLSLMSGCCSSTEKRPGRKARHTSSKSTGVSSAGSTSDSGSDALNLLAIQNEPEEYRPMTNQEAQTEKLYERLESSYNMFKRENYDAALNEVELIQQHIHDDPYLEMQTWYMSVIIYDKTGKTSRRKRAMNKLLKSMEEAQKDPRYKNARDLMISSQDMAKIAIEAGKDRYEE